MWQRRTNRPGYRGFDRGALQQRGRDSADAILSRRQAAATSYTRSVGLAVIRHGIPRGRPRFDAAPMLTGMDLRRRPLTGADQYARTVPKSRWDASPIPQTSPRRRCSCSPDAARHITMHDLRVDGGATLVMWSCRWPISYPSNAAAIHAAHPARASIRLCRRRDFDVARILGDAFVGGQAGRTVSAPSPTSSRSAGGCACGRL